MQEGAAQQSVPLAASGDTHRPHTELGRHRVDACGVLDREHDHVDHDERVSDVWLEDRGGSGDGDRLHRLLGADAVGAAESDGRGDHALRTDRVVASRAPDPRLGIWMSVATRCPRSRGFRRAERWLFGHELLVTAVQSRLIVIDSITTSCFGRSCAPVSTAAIASTTSRDG